MEIQASNGHSNTVTIFDLKTLKVLGTALTGNGPDAIIYDPASKRVFAFNRHGGDATAIDAASGKPVGKVLATPAIDWGMDAIAFDPGTGLAFSSNAYGTLTVVHEDTPQKFTPMGNVPTQRGARTMALDLKTHHIFLVTAEFEPTPWPTRERPGPWPRAIPGTFTLLVFWGVKLLYWRSIGSKEFSSGTLTPRMTC